MKIDNKLVVLGLAGLGVLGYLYYKRKKDSELLREEQSYDDGLGGGGSFGMPIGTPAPYANPIVINQPILKDKSKKKAKADIESKPALAKTPSLASTPILSSTPSTSGTTTSGSGVASTSGRVAPPTINRVGGSVSVIDRPTDIQYRYRNAPSSSTPLSSSFMDFDGNEDVKRSALDIELDVD